MKTLKIFLASSNELQTEREMMASVANNLNTVLERQGINVIIVQWENLDASVGLNHKQDDYNEKLRECDMCMVLYWTKFGMYTKIELETAINGFKEGHNPKKVYVYFKEDNSEVTDELKNFRDSFPTRYGHFYSHFSNFDTLKAHFLLQFMTYLGQILPEGRGVEVKNGKVTIDGVEYVDLKNVPFAGNNEEYNLLQKNIKNTQKLLAITETDDPDYSEYAKDLNEMKEKLARMESSLWDTALMITRLSTTKCSERLERAMQLFNKGDNKGALAVLNEEEIEKDAQHNINLIKLGETGREGLKTNIQEFEMRISSLKSEMTPGWLDETIKLREKILEWTRLLFGNNHHDTAYTLNNLAVAYHSIGDHHKALDYYSKALSVIKGNNTDTASIYDNIATCYCDLRNYERALDYSLKSLNIRTSIFGEKHPITACSYNMIANVYHNLADYEHSLEFGLRALSIREEVLGEESLATAQSYNDMAAVYSDIGEIKKRQDYILKSLRIRENILGERHPDIARSFNNVANLYFDLGDLNKSLEYYLKALNIGLEIYGEKHPDIAGVYINLANVYEELGNADKSQVCHLKALSIRESILGNNHPDTIVSSYETGNFFFRMADLDKAEHYFQVAAMFNDVKALNMLSYVYLRKGMPELALEAIDKAIAMEPSNVYFLDSKGEHLFNLGRFDEAKEMWMEVIKLDPEFDKHVDSTLFKGLKSKGLI